MICHWCRRVMSAREGKRFCCDGCRIKSHRYDRAMRRVNELHAEMTRKLKGYVKHGT